MAYSKRLKIFSLILLTYLYLPCCYTTIFLTPKVLLIETPARNNLNSYLQNKTYALSESQQRNLSINCISNRQTRWTDPRALRVPEFKKETNEDNILYGTIPLLVSKLNIYRGKESQPTTTNFSCGFLTESPKNQNVTCVEINYKSPKLIDLQVWDGIQFHQCHPRSPRSDDEGHEKYRDHSHLRPQINQSRIYNTTTTTKTESPSSFSLDTNLILIITLFLVVILLAISSYCVIRYRSNQILSSSTVDEFFKGVIKFNKSDDDAAETLVYTLPYDKEKYELHRKSFEIETSSFIGSGRFGPVRRGTIVRDEKTIDVAVRMRMIRAGDKHSSGYHTDDRALNVLLSEIKLLSYVGMHKHIVTLVGAYTEELKMGRVIVFTELCERGSLENHLRGLGRPVETCEGISITEIPKQDMLRWSQEIACGMEYLASKKVAIIENLLTIS